MEKDAPSKTSAAVKAVHEQVKEDTMKYIIGGLGVVVGFAWNTAISHLIEIIFPFGKGSIIAELAYALALTIAMVVVTIILIKKSHKN